MNKRDINKLSNEEQGFIYSYGLEKEDYETIKWLENNYDLAVYNGLL